MGLLDRLFGKRHGGGVRFAAPSRPQLTPELKLYVESLKALHKQYGSFSGAGHDPARVIGREINQHHGYNGMVTVCDTLRFKISVNAAQTLEYVWDGIGEWQS